MTVSAERATTRPVDGDHALEARTLGRGERLGAGLEDELDDAGVVAQVDEKKLAVVALPVYPTREPHLAADVRQPKVAAAVRTVGVHVMFRVS